MFRRRRYALTFAILCLPLAVVSGPPTSRADDARPATGPAGGLAHNAALCYWIAFTQLPTLDAAQEKILEDWKTTPLNAESRKVIQSAATSLRYLPYGSRLPRCDWGLPMEEGPSLLLPHLGKGRQLARLALLRARVRFEAGDSRAAVDDVGDVLALGRHLGSDGILISALVRYAVEESAADAAAPHLAGLDAVTLDRLAARFDQLPPAPRPGDSVRVEQEIGQRWLIGRLREAARDGTWRHTLASALDAPGEGGAPADPTRALIQESGGTAEGVIAQLEKLDTFYDAVGPILQLPPEQFRAHYAELTEQVKGNVFAKAILPAYEHVYDADARYRARIALFRAAVDVARGGPDEVKGSRDPFGDGPFEYRAVPGGFNLRSHLHLGTKPDQEPDPVTLTVGGGKAKP